jgi:hypothetical protein
VVPKGITMSIEKYMAAIERHLQTADCTVDAETKKLEIKFARMFLARLRHECAQVPEAEMVRTHPDAHDLLERGLPDDAKKVA